MQQININDDTPSNTIDEMVNIVDIDSLVNLTDNSIIEAVIKNKQSMDQENEEYIKKLNQQNDTGSQTSSRSEVDRLSRNLDNLVGNIVNTAINKNKVNEDNINELINQINQETEKKLDLNNVTALELSEAEKRKQEHIKLMEE
jgi:predicted RNA-binding Zn ribbon-like protein